MIKVTPITPRPQHDLEVRFRKFHSENPQIFELFKHLAGKVRAAGHQKYSAQAIMHIIRWHHDIKSSSKQFKISNDFIALYARLLMEDDQKFTDFFDTRPMKRLSF